MSSIYGKHYILCHVFFFKLPQRMKKLKTRHKIYHPSDNVDIWFPSMTLTFKVGIWFFWMTYHVIMVNICSCILLFSSYIQNVFASGEMNRASFCIPLFSSKRWGPKTVNLPDGSCDTLVKSRSSLFKNFPNLFIDTDAWISSININGAMFKANRKMLNSVIATNAVWGSNLWSSRV